jgi:predicted amidohydrolase
MGTRLCMTPVPEAASSAEVSRCCDYNTLHAPLARAAPIGFAGRAGFMPSWAAAQSGARSDRRAAGPGGTMVTVACIQMEPIIGEKERNVRRSLDLVAEAAGRGAALVVLPELCNSGYVFESRDEALGLAEPIPSGRTVQAWAEAARTHRLHLVAGIAERDGAGLYNSAVVVGPEGHVGTFRKVHLWNEENRIFDRGDLGFPVFSTPIGRIGTFICYDGWFPESYRLCALQGADIVCIPTNWVPIPGQARGREAMANILVMAAAHANSVFVAAADRVGVERGQPFIGQSLIASYTGWPIGGPASPDREEIIYAEADLADAKRARRWNDYNEVLHDRRTDVYDEMLGAASRAGRY